MKRYSYLFGVAFLLLFAGYQFFRIAMPDVFHGHATLFEFVIISAFFFLGIWVTSPLLQGRYFELENLKEGASFQLTNWTDFSHDGYAPGKWILMTILINKEWVLLVVYGPNILCTLKENNNYFVRKGKIRSENHGKPEPKPEPQEELTATKDSSSNVAGPCI